MKNYILIFFISTLLITASGCLVSESDYKQVEAERNELKKALLDAEEENRLLNDSIMEIYKEREKLQQEIKSYKAEIAALKTPGSAETAETRPEDVKYYKVVPGDTLVRISQKTKTSLEKLRELNDLRRDIVWVGQKLRLN